MTHNERWLPGGCVEHPIDREHRLACGHWRTGRAQKIPYRAGIGLYCYDCAAWVVSLSGPVEKGAEGEVTP